MHEASRVNSGLFTRLTIFSEEFSHNNSNIGSGSIPEASRSDTSEMLSVPGSRLLLLGVMKGGSNGTLGTAVSMSSLTNYPANPAHSYS